MLDLRAATPLDPDVLALTTAQQLELAAEYGDDQPVIGALPPDITFTVLTLDDTPVGCVGLMPIEDGLGEVKRMYVAPAARGRGLSRLLLEAVEKAAAARDIHRLRLETGVRQAAAIALYTGSGYQPIPAYPPFEDEPASVCFAKELKVQHQV